MGGLVILVAVGALSGLLSLWLVLRFLWRVYAKGGADDMRQAAGAIRDTPLATAAPVQAGPPAQIRGRRAGGDGRQLSAAWTMDEHSAHVAYVAFADDL